MVPYRRDLSPIYCMTTLNCVNHALCFFCHTISPLTIVYTATGNELFYQYNTSKNYSPGYAMIDFATEKNSSATGQKKLHLRHGNNGSTTYNLSYDSLGNLSTIKAGTNTLASYTYNSYNGKLLTTTYGNGYTVTNVYDKLDRLYQIKYSV